MNDPADLLDDQQCRRLSPDGLFLCILDDGHDGQHVGQKLTPIAP